MKRLILGLLVACGGHDSTPMKNDAAVDAGPATVMEVACATPAATIITTDAVFAFQPQSVTINVGQQVKFTMSSEHDVESNTSGGDAGLFVDFNTTKCLVFTKAGTFHFHCGPHGFMGSVVVQ